MANNRQKFKGNKNKNNNSRNNKPYAKVEKDFNPDKEYIQKSVQDAVRKDEFKLIRAFQNMSGMNLLTMNPYIANEVLKSLSALPKKYTREEINKMLSNPRDSENQLVSLSYYIKNVILQYQNAVEYYAKINNYNVFTYPVGVDLFDVKEDKFKKSYFEAINLVEDMSIPALAHTLAEGIILEDSKFYYLAESDYGWRLVPLPREYCKITAWSKELNMYLLSFNMMWFRKVGVDVRQYGDWWIEAEKEMYQYGDKLIPQPYDVEILKKHDGSYAYWKQLPVGFGWVFKYDLNTAVSKPPLSGLFNDALAVENYKQMYFDNAVVNSWKLLLNKVGFQTDSNGHNELNISADMAEYFNEQIQQSVPKGVTSAVSPFDDTKVVDFSANAQTKDNIVGTGQKNFFDSVGINQNVMGGGVTGGAVAVTLSHYTDATKLEAVIVPQLKSLLNYILRENVKSFRWRTDFVVSTKQTREKLFQQYKELATSGFPIERLIACAGISQAEFEGCLIMEDIMDTKSKLIPLMSSYTTDTTEMLNGGTSNKKDRTGISDSTDKSIDNGDREFNEGFGDFLNGGGEG